MKLELKHLAGYLPYGLHCIYNGRETEIEFMSKDGVLTNDSFQFRINYSELKPILRPLSDLTKEIEVNGEKFVPYDKLNYKPTIKHVSDYPFNYNDLQFIAHYSFQLLIEWHFDIHGLIEKDLAININTLK